MIAFKCPTCGCKDFAEPCFNCGMPMVAYEAGHTPEPGCPNVIGDEMRPHMDWSLGHTVTSKSARAQEYKARGLNMTSATERRRHIPTNAPAKSRMILCDGRNKRSKVNSQVTPVE